MITSPSSSMRPSSPRRLVLPGLAVTLLAAPGVANAAVLLPPAGPWPAAVAGATNPTAGSPFTLNGANVDTDARLRVWIPIDGRHLSTVTRISGAPTRLAGRLTSRSNHQAIRGAMLTVATQDVQTGAWTALGRVRTHGNGFVRAVLPPGLTRRAAILYWPTVSSPNPVFSRRLTIRSSGRVSISVGRYGPKVTFRGRVGGANIPDGGLRVAIQVRSSSGWVTIRLPLTTRAGRFRASYRFQQHRRYTIRAYLPSQPDWPLYGGHSPSTTVPPGALHQEA